MTVTEAVPVAGGPRSGATRSEPVESRLRPPSLRRGLVRRVELVDRLLRADASLTTVTAPAGYGKTTLLAQWAEAHGRRLAWLSADEGDRDPQALLLDLAAALDRAEPAGRVPIDAMASSHPRRDGLQRLVAAVERMTPPVTLAIDQVDRITNPMCLDLLLEMAVRLAPPTRIVVASRVALPTSRLRADGRLAEIGAEDLALGVDEATALLDGVGLDLPDDAVADLVARTEGWAAGLHLAALGMRAGTSSGGTHDHVTGDHRYIADYFETEVVARMGPGEAALLRRTSIVDRFDGSLCDAILDDRGSALRLGRIDEHHQFVVPLDGRREWYRCHQLLRDHLGRELHRREPELVPVLHSRAARWFDAHGDPETALVHAQAADDGALAARLIGDLARPMWDRGRSETVRAWFRWLEEGDHLSSWPELAVHASLVHALEGRPIETERWAAVAERSDPDEVLGDGSTMAATLAHLRAVLARHGVAAMHDDAVTARRTLSPSSQHRPAVLFAEGVSHVLQDDLVGADPILAHAFDAAEAVGATPFAAMVLAERSLVASERGDRSGARELGTRALELVGGGAFDAYWTSALVFATGARLASSASDVEGASRHLAAAAGLRPLLTYALPVVSAQALLEMGRAYVAIADPAGARAVLRQAHDILQQRPGLGSLPIGVERLRRELALVGADSGGVVALSPAELRVVPLLPTHHSLKEIGERLYVSRSTVKSQTNSIYRKLGVSSRSEAVARLHEIGLLVA